MTMHDRPDRGGGERGDDGSAILMVLMAMMVAASMSVLVLAAVVNQTKPTLLQQKHVRAFHAAEAGAGVALGQIRAALRPDPLVSTATVGDLSLLPCTDTTPLSGRVDGEPADITYSVRVTYFLLDPSGKSASWRTANAVPCRSQQPGYALIQSTGSGAGGPLVPASEGNRTTELVYSFRVDNTNAVGGPLSSGSLCWDAGSTYPPVSGQPVTLATCQPGLEQQRFSWRDDLTIILARTAAGVPMCVTGQPSSPSVSVPALLRPCDGTYVQTWGVNDDGRFERPPSGGTLRTCLTTAAAGTALASTSATAAETKCNKATTTQWTINQAVGSGRAGSPSASKPGLVMQWVNYKEYGRCLDVRLWSIDNDLILYPCKQDPATTRLRWNQGFVWEQLSGYSAYFPTTRLSRIYSYYGTSGQDFADAQAAGAPQICIQTSSSPNVALRFAVCDSSNAQKWTVNRETYTSTGSLDYTTSFTIVDTFGRCLGVGAPTVAVTGTTGTNGNSSVRTDVCNGSAAQKWNAPPTFSLSEQKNFRETTGLG